MTAVQFQPAPVRADRDDDLIHTTCCHDDDLALCGADLTGEPWTEGGDNLCVVCEALLDAEDADGVVYCLCPCCVPILVADSDARQK